VKIAYIVGTFPGLTTTFIEREFVAVAERGCGLVVISVRPTERRVAGQGVEDLAMCTHYLLPVRWGRLFKAHLRFGLSQFGTYTRTLLYLLTRPHPSLKARVKTFLHFVEGVYAAEVLRGEGANLLHAHFVDRAATIALVAARLLRLPYSLTAHARDIYVNPVLLREKMGEARFVVTCTAYNKAHLEQIIGPSAAGKIHLVYHGIDVSRFPVNGRAPNVAPCVLAVGRLQEKKGFAHLVKACHLLRQRGYRFTCEIVGDGPERASLQDLIDRLDLGVVVTLGGRLPFADVMARYRRADVFALPSVLAGDGDRDGIPNVLLEAMASELPVISTNVSGIPELVQDGVSGCLVPPGDATALANALARLLDNAYLRATLGRAGRVTVAQNFDIHRNVDRLLALFVAHASQTP
jgi:glycosyltransferase involved in cell wall biosynthesis